MEEITFTDVIGVAVLIFIVFLILLFIARWVFAVDRQIKIQEGQTKLLIEIAQQQGVSKEKIDGIVNTLNR